MQLKPKILNKTQNRYKTKYYIQNKQLVEKISS